MFRDRLTAAFLGSLLTVLGLAAAQAAGGAWPQGYELAEKAESPDGRYGVLIPSQDTGESMDEDQVPDTLVELKTHRRLAVIRGAHYWHQNHRGLTVR